MSVGYRLIELPTESVFLNLGRFYSRYKEAFFYYQTRKVITDKVNGIKGYSAYTFRLNKYDCKERDEMGRLLPVLMCHMSEKGLSLPKEIVKDVRKNENRVYFYSIGYADFMLSTTELETGLTSEDENLIISLFKN